MNAITDEELPPLPDEVDAVRCMIRGEMDYSEAGDYYYTQQQMRDYARTALAAKSAEVEGLKKVVDSYRQQKILSDAAMEKSNEHQDQ